MCGSSLHFIHVLIWLHNRSGCINTKFLTGLCFQQNSLSNMDESVVASSIKGYANTTQEEIYWWRSLINLTTTEYSALVSNYSTQWMCGPGQSIQIEEHHHVNTIQVHLRMLQNSYRINSKILFKKRLTIQFSIEELYFESV